MSASISLFDNAMQCNSPAGPQLAGISPSWPFGGVKTQPYQIVQTNAGPRLEQDKFNLGTNRSIDRREAG
jgi:hypothetical protein